MLAIEKNGLDSYDINNESGDALRRELEHFANVIKFGGEFLTPAERELEALEEMQKVLLG